MAEVSVSPSEPTSANQASESVANVSTSAILPKRKRSPARKDSSKRAKKDLPIIEKEEWLQSSPWNTSDNTINQNQRVEESLDTVLELQNQESSQVEILAAKTQWGEELVLNEQFQQAVDVLEPVVTAYRGPRSHSRIKANIALAAAYLKQPSSAYKAIELLKKFTKIQDLDPQLNLTYLLLLAQARYRDRQLSEVETTLNQIFATYRAPKDDTSYDLEKVVDCLGAYGAYDDKITPKEESLRLLDIFVEDCQTRLLETNPWLLRLRIRFSVVIFESGQREEGIRNLEHIFQSLLSRAPGEEKDDLFWSYSALQDMYDENGLTNKAKELRKELSDQRFDGHHKLFKDVQFDNEVFGDSEEEEPVASVW